jgi:hypothetical protein
MSVSMGKRCDNIRITTSQTPFVELKNIVTSHFPAFMQNGVCRCILKTLTEKQQKLKTTSFASFLAWETS